MSFFNSSLSNNESTKDEDFFDNSPELFSPPKSSQDNFFPSIQNTLNTQFFSASSIDSQQKQIFTQFSTTFSQKFNSNETQNDGSTNEQPILFDGNNSDDLFKDSESTNNSEESSSQSNSPESHQESQSCQLIFNGSEDLSTLPESIIQLYREIKENYSDWTFTSIIVGQLCSDKFPMRAYAHLKLPLIMSLVTSRENKLHIMGVGQDISHASIIMNFIGKFAQRFIRVATNFDGITVNNNNIIEGGAISLATNGVALLGNWQRIPQKSALKLLREIETKTILVDKIQGNYPLQTTIWAYWNYTSKIKKDLASISQFINVFGIPIIIDEVNSEEIQEVIDDLLNQVLTKPFDRSNDFQIPDSDFHTYLNYARNLTVTFDSRAIDMLKNYFMATKIIRPDALSEKGYMTLKIMAESHARLSLRNIVTRQDVLVAISIAEKYIREFFDKDSYTSPAFLHTTTEETSIDCYDKYMNDLYEWYLNFTKDILEKL